MGKEELLDALVELQSAAFVDNVRSQFVTIQKALNDIQRKRWKFVEDACSSVLRTVFHRLVHDSDGQSSCAKNPKLSTCQGIDLCLEFLEPLLDSTVCIVDALDDEQEAAGQRGIVVAALLALFTKSPNEKEINSRLVLNVLKCGVDMHVLISTLRFREELVECQRVLLPPDESESEELEMEEDEVLESKSDDMWWITEQVAKVWGFTHYRYFLAASGQDHTFAAWSCSGIANLIYAMIFEEKLEHALSAIVSPFSWLFLLASFAHCRIVSEEQEERYRGLEMLRFAVDLCPQGKLACQIRDMTTTTAQSFRGQAALFHERNWISPLIQVITNAMVSFSDAIHRTKALSVLTKVVSKLVDASRFWILRTLVVECPYGNVAAILVDFVRNDTVHAWSSSDALLQSPFRTTAICSLLYEALAQAAERDLVLHADLIASCLSLYRFLHIRDKDNTTGIRTKTDDRDISRVITRISKRLDVIVHEASLYGSAHSDMTHLIILEASLGSTLELCNKS